MRGSTLMTIEFNGEIWFWKGPAPHHFVTVPAKQCRDLKAISGVVTYGWGMIPVQVRIGNSEWRLPCSPKMAATSCPSRRVSEKRRILRKATRWLYDSKLSEKHARGDVRVVGLQLYDMRHVRVRAAQLSLLLGRKGPSAPDPVATARIESTVPTARLTARPSC